MNNLNEKKEIDEMLCHQKQSQGFEKNEKEEA